MGVSPGRNITEKPLDDELFIAFVSSDGEEHDSDFVSRSNGDPDRCMARGSTESSKKPFLPEDRLKCRFNWDVLYEPDTSIELFRSAAVTAVINPGELVDNG